MDTENVCCMCGDVGFPEKLFRCIKCHHRIQHSYCSSYYTESSQEIKQCDWCQSEVTTTTSSKKLRTHRSEYSIDKVKPHRDDTSSTEKGKSSSPRTSTRRYKLLKDVMC